MNESADIVVLGGGCAGLSLGVALAERDLGDRRVLVLEGRTDYGRDRTWCGWSLEPHPFQSLVDHSWASWRLRLGGDESVHRSSQFRYEHLRADRFYADAVRRIARSPSVELRLGARVTGHRAVSDEGPAGARAVTFVIDGEAREVVARTVVDARPPARPAPKGALLQHFLGQEVTTADAVFEPAVATLMDFDVPQCGAIHFVYVLPFSERRALIESTVLSPEPLGARAYEEQIARYVAERLGTRIETVHYAEQGVIPMHAPVGGAAGGDGLLLAGTAGGAIKPSSGYGFHAIQRTTAALADALAASLAASPAASAAGGEAAAPVAARSRVDGWLDEVFLAFLARHPERGPEVFARMFRAAPPDAFVRFLMERPRLSDRLRVIGSMPKLPFAREALRASFR